jgi:protein tyrosine phosphatase
VKVCKEGYFNASHMKLISKGDCNIIACQAPVKPYSTFWQAIIEQNVGLIIMLCAFRDPNRGVIFNLVRIKHKSTGLMIRDNYIQMVSPLKSANNHIHHSQILSREHLQYNSKGNNKEPLHTFM